MCLYICLYIYIHIYIYIYIYIYICISKRTPRCENTAHHATKDVQSTAFQYFPSTHDCVSDNSIRCCAGRLNTSTTSARYDAEPRSSEQHVQPSYAPRKDQGAICASPTGVSLTEGRYGDSKTAKDESEEETSKSMKPACVTTHSANSDQLMYVVTVDEECPCSFGGGVRQIEARMERSAMVCELEKEIKAKLGEGPLPCHYLSLVTLSGTELASQKRLVDYFDQVRSHLCTIHTSKIMVACTCVCV
jgi:hypothetical protein